MAHLCILVTPPVRLCIPLPPYQLFASSLHSCMVVNVSVSVNVCSSHVCHVLYFFTVVCHFLHVCRVFLVYSYCHMTQLISLLSLFHVGVIISVISQYSMSPLELGNFCIFTSWLFSYFQTV